LCKQPKKCYSSPSDSLLLFLSPSPKLQVPFKFPPLRCYLKDLVHLKRKPVLKTKVNGIKTIKILTKKVNFKKESLYDETKSTKKDKQENKWLEIRLST